MKIFTPVLLLSFILLLGCASSGRKLNPEAVNQLQVGMTKQQVMQLIGYPEHITTGEGGKTYFVYYHGSTVGLVGAKGEMHMLNLTFGPDFRLIHVDKSITHQKARLFGPTRTTEIEQGKY